MTVYTEATYIYCSLRRQKELLVDTGPQELATGARHVGTGDRIKILPGRHQPTSPRGVCYVIASKRTTRPGRGGTKGGKTTLDGMLTAMAMVGPITVVRSERSEKAHPSVARNGAIHARGPSAPSDDARGSAHGTRRRKSAVGGGDVQARRRRRRAFGRSCHCRRAGSATTAPCAPLCMTQSSSSTCRQRRTQRPGRNGQNTADPSQAGAA